MFCFKKGITAIVNLILKIKIYLKAFLGMVIEFSISRGIFSVFKVSNRVNLFIEFFFLISFRIVVSF